MAHYDCSCCGEHLGVSHNHCPECQAGRCHRAKEKSDNNEKGDK